MKQKLQAIKNNPEFQAKLQEIKPQRNIWGVLGIFLLFFLPEILNYYYSSEINHWVVELANATDHIEMKELLLWSAPKLFDGELSFVNIGLGIAFLVWMFRK